MRTVSVVIPTYNRAALLEATLRSIFAQTLPAAEIIVVDDGSTDDTERVCARYSESIRYVYQQNTGLSGARNRGIREANGEWIALCDSDDLWHPRKLELQMDALRHAPDARWSITGFHLIGPDGQPVPGGNEWARVFQVFSSSAISPDAYFTHYLVRVRFSTGGDFRAMYYGDLYEALFHGNVALPSSAVVARSLLDRAGLFDERFREGEETEFFHRMAAFSPVALLDEPLVKYRLGHASMISTGDPQRFVQGALASLERAARLRTPLSAGEQAAYLRGRRGLRMRLAYTRLSVLDQAGARAALWEMWREGGSPCLRSAGMLAASLLPTSLLRGLHWAKRAVRGT